MADMSSDGADRPGSDLALSSDEDDYLSSQSTTSMAPESHFESTLSSSIGHLHLKADSSSSFNPVATPTSNAGNGTSICPAPNQRSPNKQMQLLDLPLDILKDIIKEVTHTSDLTSLALTCSALHAITTPHMYSRFDIVWPETLHPSSEEYSGVDALSYGLATLVMGEDVFRQHPSPRDTRSRNGCAQCGCASHGHHTTGPTQKTRTGFLARRGNHYAQYTKVFSIGNGPSSWVQEYSVNREIGKMLGTLVALSVVRMINLEAFVWDMPTGVVREIWLALASLADHPDHPCCLERLWVRWHDNSENVLRVAGSPVSENRLFQQYRHVEHPSLSILPPLKNVAVLDIDEPAYVEELGYLINRSRDRLVELRIGISAKAHLSTWLTCQKDADGAQSLGSWPRPGGVLSILTDHEGPVQDSGDSSAIPGSYPESTEHTGGSISPTSSHSESRTSTPVLQSRDEKLNLKVFELERVPLSVPMLLPAIDWTRLTTLTLMQCKDHDNLWRALRRKYAPPEASQKMSYSSGRAQSRNKDTEYPLSIKHLRTDNVTPHFMLFIKDALAPDTLESVYLHEAPEYNSSVQVEAIYRHVLRRHRLSLKKVLIDATERPSSTDGLGVKWKKWMFTREMIEFVSSGRMPQLRELGMAMSHKDWHYLLQRLPNMTQLRVLYVTRIGLAPHCDVKELAMQVLDIVSIRPDLMITYVGFIAKCFQIQEFRGSSIDNQDSPTTDSSTQSNDDELSVSDEEAEYSHLNTQPSGSGNEEDLLSNDLFDDDDSDSGEFRASRSEFKLQEILFYDEKISIFKMRHGVI